MGSRYILRLQPLRLVGLVWLSSNELFVLGPPLFPLLRLLMVMYARPT